MRVLDDVNARWLASSGCESFPEVRFTGFTDGDLSRGTGDGKFDGETSWVGCGCFFLVTGRGGEEKVTGHVQQGRFSLNDTRY
jgi:hypothetical protein